jgi:superfamily II DNA/RNA helicase
MNNYINKNKDSIFKNKKKLLSFLSKPESIYYYNSNDKIHISCAKSDAVDMIIANTAKEEKIIIFSSFIDVLNSFYDHLKKSGHNAIVITGKDRGGELDGKFKMFKDTDAFKILLTTLFKSAEGLNLDAANHVIILEFWWNPQKIIQAIGRIDRINQKRNVFIYILCYNQNCEIYEPELQYYKIMERKIEYSKHFIIFQQYLPEIMLFDNEITFKQKFQLFLENLKKEQNENIKKNNVIQIEEKLLDLNDKSENTNCNKNDLVNIVVETMMERYKKELYSQIFPPTNYDGIEFLLD